MNTSQLKDQLQGFKAEFSKITRARHPLEIKHFIVGSHTSRWRQWYQLCIECDSKWMALQEAEAKHRIAALDIELLELKLDSLKNTKNWVGEDIPRTGQIEIEKLQIEIQQKRNQYERDEGYMLGALKEIHDFLHLAKTEYAEFWGKSEDELVKAGERDYWNQRLSDQIAVDLLTYGRIQAGNLNVLLQAPKDLRADILRAGLTKQQEYQKFALPIQEEFDKLAGSETPKLEAL